MEKSKKFELLNQFIQALELKPQEAIEFFKMQSAGVIANKNLLEPGMFYYADQTFSKKLIPNKIVSGVVGYVEKNRALVVALNEEKLPWSDGLFSVGETKNLFEGKEATRLLAKVFRFGVKKEAALWCFKFRGNGIIQGDAFLSSTHEWDNLSVNLEVINNSLGLLKAPLLKGIYWSSNEDDSYSAMVMRLDDLSKYQCRKDVELFVRPMFWV